MTDTHPDVYFKKLVTFRFWRQELRFRVSQDLFSSHQVDVGTQFLLRAIKELDPGRFPRVLDLGCGYGPIGLTLGKLNQAAWVHMVDRDALAVEYCRRNAEINGLPNVSVYGSLGYDDVRARDFDLIACNIPAKAGQTVISHLLRDAGRHLRPGGVAAVVVVAAIERMVEEALEAEPAISLLFKRTRRGHAVFAYEFTEDIRGAHPPEESAFRRGVYHRGTATVAVGAQRLAIDAAWGLPEFESPSFRSRLLIEALASMPRAETDSAVVYNPGQGHTAVALAKLLRPRSIRLVDRDLLALRQTRLNLARNGLPQDGVTPTHRVGLDCGADGPVQVIAGVIREDEGPRAAGLLLNQAAERIVRGGTLALSASSTAITRIIETAEPLGVFEVRGRQRWRGNSLVVLRRR